MAATVIDVAREFVSRIAPLPIPYAFFLYDRLRNTIVFTTFFEVFESKAEEELARIEGYMLDSFGEYLMEFHTIHLLGRDIEDFVPDGAVPLIPTQRRLLRPAVHRVATNQ